MYLIAVTTAREALNKPFMPDYDPKNIPILDDVIESANSEKRDFDLSVGSDEPLNAKSDATENKLDLFANEAIDSAAEGSDMALPVIEVETLTVTDSIIENTINPGTISPAAEPQTGSVDSISDENGDGAPLYSPAKAYEDEAEKFESALIGYNAVDEGEIPTINVPDIDQQENDQPLEEKQQTSTAISLQSVTDDIVKQLMPELEQQLRLLLEQALKEKLPEDIKQTDIPSASNPDN